MSGRQHEGNGQREKEERAKKSTYKNEVGSEQGEKRGRAIETRIIQNKLHPTGQQDRCWLQDRTHQYINERKMPCWSIATMGATKTAMSKSISFPLFHISMSCLAQQCSRALHIESSQASKLRGVGFCFLSSSDFFVASRSIEWSAFQCRCTSPVLDWPPEVPIENLWFSTLFEQQLVQFYNQIQFRGFF